MDSPWPIPWPDEGIFADMAPRGVELDDPSPVP